MVSDTQPAISTDCFISYISSANIVRDADINKKELLFETQWTHHRKKSPVTGIEHCHVCLPPSESKHGITTTGSYCNYAAIIDKSMFPPRPPSPPSRENICTHEAGRCPPRSRILWSCHADFMQIKKLKTRFPPSRYTGKRNASNNHIVNRMVCENSVEQESIFSFTPTTTKNKNGRHRRVL